MEQSFYLEIFVTEHWYYVRYDMLIIYVNQEEKKLKPKTWYSSKEITNHAPLILDPVSEEVKKNIDTFR